MADISKMLFGAELENRLLRLPAYDTNICKKEPQERLVRLNDLYDIYLPSVMSQEIYCRLYTTLMKSLMQKETVLAVRQSYENNKCLRRQHYKGLMGGVDACTIIGPSGIGKSASVSAAVNLIEEQIQEDELLPFVIVQCPFDSSVKGLLLEILRIIDGLLDTKYYESAKRKNATTDVLIGMVSQVCLNNVGILIVDEIQNVVNSRNGRVLVGMLTQLINNSGIGICMVGTPECTVFFEQAFQLSRRSLGLTYDAWEYGDTFCGFCRKLMQYQYVQFQCECTEEILLWLYEHSNGIASVVISLLHDAQELAILSGYERLDIRMLEEAYQKRLSMLHGYIRPKLLKPVGQRPKSSRPAIRKQESGNNDIGMSLIQMHNADDFWDELFQMVPVEEVMV